MKPSSFLNGLIDGLHRRVKTGSRFTSFRDGQRIWFEPRHPVASSAREGRLFNVVLPDVSGD
jgi:hypothetical protein